MVPHIQNAFRRGGPIFIYGLGLASIFLADVLVTKFAAPQQISLWAIDRAVAVISPTLVLCGLEHTFLRVRRFKSYTLNFSIIHIVLFPVVVSLILEGTDLSAGFLTSVMIVVGSCLSYTGFHFLRAEGTLFASQLSYNGWKVVLVLLLILGQVTDGASPVTFLAIALTLGGLFAIIALRSSFRPLRRQRAFRAAQVVYPVGIRFMMMTLLAGVGVYADQILIRKLGGTGASAIYFTHSTYFIMPMSLINGYAAFSLAPWLLRNRSDFLHIYDRFKILFLLLVVTYVCAMGALGLVSWIIIRPGDGRIFPILTLVFLLCSVLKTIYVVPSAYVGILGQRCHQNMIIRWEVASVLISGGAIAILYYALDAPILVVALGSFCNWTLRVLVGCGVLRKLISTERGVLRKRTST